MAIRDIHRITHTNIFEILNILSVDSHIGAIYIGQFILVLGGSYLKNLEQTYTDRQVYMLLM